MNHDRNKFASLFLCLAGGVLIQTALPLRAHGEEYLYGSPIEDKHEKAERLRREALSRQTQSDASMSIFTRKQSEYDPLNIRVGSFLIEPNSTLSYGYIDNVFGTQDNEVDSRIMIGEVGVKFKSDLPVHFIEGAFLVEDGRFLDQSSENYKDIESYLGGRIDIGSNIQIPLALKYAEDHTKRDDPEDTDGATPTEFKTSSIVSGVKYIGYLINVAYQNIISRVSYEDNKTALNSFIYNGDRDRTEISHALTFSTLDSARLSPFIYADYKTVNYHDGVDDFGIDRDSHGWGAGGGFRLSLSGQTSMTVKYGGLFRSFDDVSLNDVSSNSYGLDFNWEPSSLLGLSLSGQRYVDDSSLVNTSASINTSFSLRANYELTPNIYLYPELRYLVKDYQSADNRRTERFSSGIRMSYKLNRNMWSSVMFENATQDEKRSGFVPTSSETNQVMVSLKFQM